MTGFRVGPAGHWGLTGAVEGWAPDLFTFGKVMGGGLPAAAFGGRADVMGMLAPAGPVYQAGHPGREPDRGHVRPGHAARVRRRRSTRPSTGVRAPGRRARADALHRRGRGAPRAGRGQPLQRLLHRPAGARLRRRPRAQEAWRYRAFFHAMLDAGVYLPPSAFEAWFVSAAHDDAALDRVVAALPQLPAQPRRRAARDARQWWPNWTPTEGARMSDAHHRPPAAPRRGAQPRGRPLRPPAGLPPLRPRPARWPIGRPRPWPAATSPW